MKKLAYTAIAAVITLAFSAGSTATGMTKYEYKSGKAGIAAQYKSARVDCDSLSANAKQVCIADARGKGRVAKAELDASYKPTNKARYDVGVARAEANYSLAMQRCDDKAGNVKDVCVKEAGAAVVAAKADAKALLKTDNANEKAAEVSAKAIKQAKDKGAGARKDAASDKRDADYAVAKERCDILAGDPKAACIKNAKTRYSQS